MASNRALLELMSEHRRRLETQSPARSGGYRANRSVNPRTVRPPPGPSVIPPKPVPANGEERVVVQVMVMSDSGMQFGGDVPLAPKSAEQRARLDELQRARLRFVEGVDTDAEVQRLESGQPGELPGEDKHADVADLAVPDERRPSRRAPIRRLAKCSHPLVYAAIVICLLKHELLKARDRGEDSEIYVSAMMRCKVCGDRYGDHESTYCSTAVGICTGERVHRGSLASSTLARLRRQALASDDSVLGRAEKLSVVDEGLTRAVVFGLLADRPVSDDRLADRDGGTVRVRALPDQDRAPGAVEARQRPTDVSSDAQPSRHGRAVLEREVLVERLDFFGDGDLGAASELALERRYRAC